MLESINKIERYVEGYDISKFLSEDKTIDAVVRNFEIIGEAANRISDEFKYQNSAIPWNRLRGIRNRIVHEYFGIDHEIVWNIIDHQLEELRILLETVSDPN